MRAEIKVPLGGMNYLAVNHGSGKRIPAFPRSSIGFHEEPRLVTLLDGHKCDLRLILFPIVILKQLAGFADRHHLLAQQLMVTKAELGQLI